MKYIFKNLSFPADAEQNIKSKVCALLHIPANSINSLQIIRKALDTRKKNHPIYIYTIELDICTRNELKFPDLQLLLTESEETIHRVKLHNNQPIIVGMGPAGLFCALAMVENGLKPILFERGDELSIRSMQVDSFWKNGILDTNSNVQFGEGGAGAFSDGKLTSRSANPSTKKVFDWLIRFGADESIKWDAHPHLGTDVIRMIVKNIRDYLISKGCIFYYNNMLTDVSVIDSKLTSITINGTIYKPEIAVLALGNAARDTYRLLDKRGVLLETKQIAMGFRICHPQDWINKAIYGSEQWAQRLGAASYRLTANQAGKGTYTFCMCPGGYIVAASSENSSIVTNGMSYSDRSRPFGNSAIVTQFDISDYGSNLFGAMELQKYIEHKAYMQNYAAPFQTAIDYMVDTISQKVTHRELFTDLQPYKIAELFTPQINDSLKKGLKHFDRILPGFIKEGLLIAPETRTSSPIRIVRDKAHRSCLNIPNLYAIGEGSGYAGGIISSAADGISTGMVFYH